MSLRVDVPFEVVEEIADIGHYIAKHNATAGTRFVDAADREMKRIGEFPEIGGLLEWVNCRIKNVRVWPIPDFENYVMLYTVARDRIRILHVTHGGRDLQQLLDK